MDNGLSGGGRILGQPQGIAIVEWRLLHVATFEVLDGGLANDQCSQHVRIIDVPKATAYLVPLSPDQISNAMEMLA